MKQENLSLANLKGGAAVEMSDISLKRTLENIADINTSAKAKREITLKVAFVPTEDREAIAIAINCKTTLAGADGISAIAFIGVDENGEIAATERNGKQPTLHFDAEDSAH